MELSERLQTIANFVEPGQVVADIGTDHGYLSAYLIEQDIAKQVIATDINEKPLQKAIDYINNNSLTDKIETRLGCGLEALSKGEADIVIIAGMGGHLIADIIETSKEVSKSVNTFILQPMTGEEELRDYLYKNKYTIIDEKLAREGKRFYHILKVIHGRDKLEDEIYLEVGKRLLENKDELLGQLLNLKIEKIKSIMDNLIMHETPNSKKTYKEFSIKCKKLREMLKDYES